MTREFFKFLIQHQCDNSSKLLDILQSHFGLMPDDAEGVLNEFNQYKDVYNVIYQ